MAATLPTGPFGGKGGFGLTAPAADGPGHKARACLQVAQRVRCTGAVTLKASAARPAMQSLPASYVRRGVASQAGLVGCFAVLASSTRVKSGVSSVDALFVAQGSGVCTGSVQVSVNRGKTWRTVSPTQPVRASSVTGALGFSGRYFDGSKLLARACVQAAGGKRECTSGW